MRNGFVYILRCLKNDTFYIGSTIEIKSRLHQHVEGKVKATRYLLPVKLELAQKYDDIGTARYIERRIKRLKRKDYIEKIIKDKIIKMGLRRSPKKHRGGRSPDLSRHIVGIISG